MELIVLPEEWQGESALFLEGAVLASNFAVKPLEPESWVELIGLDSQEAQAMLVPHINKQHNLLQRAEYASVTELPAEDLADFAEGFMTVWPVVEQQYQDAELGDGALRMLQGLLTALMLAVDEEQTREQMSLAGIDNPPYLEDLKPQLDVMINEVAHAADELMVGAKAQALNPFKDVGRNDACPCGSGKKFKQCCGK
ncbi:SEC-C metal-binding domain-containing protein [Vibrio hannami]|uniref:SEC-C metal-binding domain-containing protein n=1 Tax=Vibrio hannami TaxID=2717094 RepID=UPI002410782D|nr:SEC-C metal-binding domain-containing protein [Vibrio hannami]MDG3087577.1 SEC-C metal-binding domain-containing protein [Vibrio hannami]